MPAGLAPIDANSLNNDIGNVLKSFSQVRTFVHQHAAWLQAEDLTLPPYNMTTDDQTLIKSAVIPLDTSLQAVDMTFISRLIGLPF